MDFSVFPSDKFPLSQHVTSCDSIEACGVEKFFRGRSWDEITFDLLKTNYPHDPAACLTFMLPTAYAFFLPAYMQIALKNYEISDAIPDSVIFDLLGMGQGKCQDKLDAVLSSYTAEQLKAIAEFLNEMSEKYWHLYPSDDAKKAYAIYWGKFLHSTIQ
jgi:hypothetical protein